MPRTYAGAFIVFLCVHKNKHIMKKLLFFALVAALHPESRAQVVPNGDFENWNSVAYEEPAGWYTGNPRDVQRFGLPCVTRVAGVSGYAIRVQSNIVGADTSDSYFINTANPCADPQNWTGGVPYSQQPGAITGSFRYNLLGNDTAALVVVFRKNGLHIGDNMFLIRGTGTQSTFTTFSYPVVCAGVPDTIIIAAATNVKGAGAMNGSFIEFDNLAFTGATQTIPGGDFDTWIPKSFDRPMGWSSWGTGVTKTATVYGGLSAVRLETMNEMCGGNNSSGITSGYMTENSGPAGGVPYTATNDTLCGYYRYTSSGGDSAAFYVSLSKNGTGVGGNYKLFPPAASYTYFEMAVQSGIVPDTLRVDIQSSKWPLTAASVGSILYVDNLYLKSDPLFVLGKERMERIELYPSPAKEVLYVRFGADKTLNGVSLFDATGRRIGIDNFIREQNALQIPVSQLASGIYFVELTSGDLIIKRKFVKQ